MLVWLTKFYLPFNASLKPGLHIVVTIGEYALDVAPKKILRLSIHRLQIFLVKCEYFWSLQLCEDQITREKLKKRVCNLRVATMCLRSLRLIWRPGFTWRSGYCYLNKGECNLNQSKDNSFAERVAKNNSWNNGNRHKIHEIFLIKVANYWKQSLTNEA